MAPEKPVPLPAWRCFQIRASLEGVLKNVKATESLYVYSKEFVDALREAWKEDCAEQGEDILADFSPDMENWEEVYNALQLIDRGAIPPNIFNTAGWVDEAEERFKDIEGTPTILGHLYLSLFSDEGFRPKEFPAEIERNYDRGYAHAENLERLRMAWEKLHPESTGERRNYIPSAAGSTPIEHFVEEVFSGRMPTPEVLLAVAKSFKLYTLAAGSLSLEEAFFGSPPKRAGSYAARSRREEKFLVFHDTLLREVGLGSFTSEKALAEKILENDRIYYSYEKPTFVDAETFLRAYRRWKAKRFPDE